MWYNYIITQGGRTQKRKGETMRKQRVQIQLVVSSTRMAKYDSRIEDLRSKKGNVDIFATQITKVRLGYDRPLFFQVTPSFLARHEVKKVLEAKVDDVNIRYFQLSYL